MAVDYSIQFPCKVREQLPDAELMRMKKARDRASAVVETLRRNPSVDRSKPESEWTIVLRVQGPQGPVDREVKIEELNREAAPLQALAPHCKGCRANLHGNDFGCSGAVHYPIPAAAEQWLLSRLPAQLDSGIGMLLLKMFKDIGVDGAPINANRKRDELYALKKPLERKWGGLLSRKTISSSQLLQMLFESGAMPPQVSRIMATALGYITDAQTPDQGAGTRPQAGDEPGIVQFKLFLWAVTMAALENVPLLIDS